jgi:hypothetical protein
MMRRKESNGFRVSTVLKYDPDNTYFQEIRYFCQVVTGLGRNTQVSQANIALALAALHLDKKGIVSLPPYGCFHQAGCKTLCYLAFGPLEKGKFS